jgi:hypothetical protein
MFVTSHHFPVCNSLNQPTVNNLPTSNKKPNLLFDAANGKWLHPDSGLIRANFGHFERKTKLERQQVKWRQI